MDLDLRPHSNNSEEHSDSSAGNQNTFTRHRGISFLARFEELLRSFSPSERLILYVLTALLSVSALVLVLDVSSFATVTVPAQGGTVTEGEVGPARFINPVLTLSQPDEDLSALVFSGLMRAMPDGSLVPDLASNYNVSNDGTTYTFTIRPGAKFHDGAPLTSDDVVFTVQTIQNPDMKSPHRADWEGVQVSAPDPATVVFKLPKPYAPFLFDTTLGIIPKHLWQSVSAEEFPFSPLNTHPIGSGPYKVAHLYTDSTGSAVSYDLAPNSSFALGTPYISRIVFLFFGNDTDMINAYNAGKISMLAGLSPADLHLITRHDTQTLSSPLPRTFGVFFNQTHAPVLADAGVRAALDAAVDKNALVDQVLSGYGIALGGPIPPGVLHESAVGIGTASTTNSVSPSDRAKSILSRDGWRLSSSTSAWVKGSGKNSQILTFTLATADEPELVATAQALAADWKAAGITVQVQVYPLSELNSSVIRPRSYDAILFGEVVGREGDFFAFWHSSQRNDPGLNLAMYANTKADAALSQARAATDQKTREKLYSQFASIVQKDQPAIFLYAPEFLYIVPKSVQGIELGALTTPAERFLNVFQWYTETQSVWDIFSNIR